jgi:hypothetical protein
MSAQYSSPLYLEALYAYVHMSNVIVCLLRCLVTIYSKICNKFLIFLKIKIDYKEYVIRTCGNVQSRSLANEGVCVANVLLMCC